MAGSEQSPPPPPLGGEPLRLHETVLITAESSGPAAPGARPGCGPSWCHTRVDRGGGRLPGRSAGWDRGGTPTWASCVCFPFGAPKEDRDPRGAWPHSLVQLG